LYGDGFRANQLQRLVQFLLSTAYNDDLSAFRRKANGGCQADAAVATGNDCDFSVEPAHGELQ